MNRPSTVLFVVPRFHTNLYVATKALCTAGMKVHLWCQKQSLTENYSFVTPTLVDETKLDWQTAARMLDEVDPDLVVLRDAGRLARITFWLCTVKRRAMVAYDQMPFLQRRNLLQIAFGFVRGRPPYRITPVPGVPRLGVVPDRLAAYLPFPVEVSGDAPERVYAPGGRVRILCVGKLVTPRKNHLLLLQALEGLVGTYDFSVTLVGTVSHGHKHGNPEYLARLRSAAQNGPLAGRLVIRADVPYADMAAVYETHDICVLPAQREPYGIAPLEAMGRGCVPVVSSECGSAGHVYGTGCGFIFRSSDAADLTAVLRPLLASPNQTAEFGRKALRYAGQEFASQTFVRRFENLLTQNGRSPESKATVGP